jgi:hypothetical protein
MIRARDPCWSIRTPTGEPPKPLPVTPAREPPGWDEGIDPLAGWGVITRPESEYQFDQSVDWYGLRTAPIKAAFRSRCCGAVRATRALSHVGFTSSASPASGCGPSPECRHQAALPPALPASRVPAIVRPISSWEGCLFYPLSLAPAWEREARAGASRVQFRGRTVHRVQNPRLSPISLSAMA